MLDALVSGASRLDGAVKRWCDGHRVADLHRFVVCPKHIGRLYLVCTASWPWYEGVMLSFVKLEPELVDTKWNRGVHHNFVSRYAR
ncbi:MAG: hypothetical protein AMXMBFR82_06730 [Candidatus Hydrogenedentota bacterium]